MDTAKRRRVVFHDGDRIIETEADPAGGMLLDLIRRQPELSLSAPCGGSGLCGKCRVRILSEPAPAPSAEDRLIFPPDVLAQGWRLACRLPVDRSLDVRLPERSGGITALMDTAVLPVGGAVRDTGLTGDRIVPTPKIRKEYRELPAPSLEDQRDDLDRLLEAAGTPGPTGVPLPLLRDLPRLLPESDYRITLVRDDSDLIAVEPGDTTGECFGIAVDIGTTTLVLYLADLRTGTLVDVASAENPQSAWGADVVSRIGHADDPAVFRELRERAAGAIDGMVRTLAGTHGIPLDRIYGGTIAGNTTMLHLFAGVPPARIAAAPFIPAFTRSLVLTAPEAGIGIHPRGRLHLLPSVSAYVGADISAAVLASGMHRSGKIALLVDIGTNGEIVLGSRDGLLCCSTAAGPAFEGAHIRCGTGGIPGAVNRVRWNDGDDGTFDIGTIRGSLPSGICGSGIVDLAAILLEQRLAEDTGRLLPREELPAEVPRPLAARMIELDGESAFLAVPADGTVSGEPLVLTQRDLREIQLAKAAIAAGIQVLLQTAGIAEEQVDTVYLAGGFGSFIDVASAVRLGLIPSRWHDRIRVLGNAAGGGALLALLDREMDSELERIAGNARYLELSSTSAFQEVYIEQMMFP